MRRGSFEHAKRAGPKWRCVLINSSFGEDGLRDCFADPIPEIFEAANLLNYAVTAHLRGDTARAALLIRAADMPIIGAWLDPIWTAPHRQVVERVPVDLPPMVLKSERHKPRDAPPQMKRDLVARDGHHCRLCGIPLVRADIRKLLTAHYPEEARWTGARETQHHRGLQVMWLQFDHVTVHSRGGQTSIENLVVTCPACNYGRDRYMMSEVGLRDPRLHIRQPTWEGCKTWDGLERILPEKDQFLGPTH
jgi:5-methylcytosine-specific restriction endonuclease McrA